MYSTEELLAQIEELKAQNSILQETVQNEKEINKKKDTLISQISHEIRTPLNVVISMAGIAKEELDNPKVVRDNLTEIANTSRILLGIVNNILDISALAGGKFHIEENKFDLKDEITNLGIYFYKHARYKNVHFDMHIQGVSQENMIGDERHLQQILINLFTNSLRFTPEGGKIDLSVTQVSSSQNMVNMRFVLQDTGSGLSEEVVHDLFLPYEENNSIYQNDYTDTGISLFVTKKLIEMLGGTAAVESKLGEGCKFIVDIPFKKTEQVDHTTENTLLRSTILDALMKIEKGNSVTGMERHKQDYMKLFDFSRKRILVVEDSVLNMEVLVRLLNRVNASVICAENGQEAVHSFNRNPAGFFDCILMDVNMPTMDGYKAAREIRESGKEDAASVPIFAMIANAFSDDIENALQAGMNGHVTKPIDVQVLYRTLNKVFNGFENPEIKDDLLEKAQLLERQNTELKERAERDPLTGLYNRYAYEKETYSLLSKKEPVCFVLIDIDYFKEINDVYGHEKGDEVLKYVANVLKANVRPTDFVVRLGGDEFAVIFRSFNPNRQQMHDKFSKVNRELLHPSINIPRVTLSIGVAFSDIGYTTELYGYADKALYQTKKNGRNGCTIYEEESWDGQNELEKLQYELKDVMNFSMDGRSDMGDSISIIGYRMLEYSMRAQLIRHFGSEQQKELFREAGYSAGLYFVEKFLDVSLGLDQFVEQLIKKLQEFKMGNLVLNRMDEVTGEAIISVYQDADCSGMISMGETICNYDEGFIAGVLSAYTNRKYTAIETECWAKGDKFCKFVASPQYKK